VGNAETRRQYLSEICQLRELRKEKRIQLLAIASMSNVIKSAPIRKPTGKITCKYVKLIIYVLLYFDKNLQIITLYHNFS